MEKVFVLISIFFVIYLIFFKRLRIFEILTVLSTLILLLIVGIRYKHFPVVGLFETLNFYALSLILIYFIWGTEDKKISNLVYIVSLVLYSLSLFGKPFTSPFVSDSLNTLLFPVHVAFSFISYAFFTLSFLYALSDRETDRVLRLNYLGFITYTIGLWSGGIWAFKAWGVYFLYGMKEIFSFVIWIYYSGIIHLKYSNNRKLINIATIVGFAIVIFTYLGIGLFMRNTHSLR
ncbi:MAG: cytochrome c biogenesis protein CcsA [Proteobacteria bacterium]|nr:cytochrome c biogenesis protein CcsA [Pseudomonadota bacterium]